MYCGYKSVEQRLLGDSVLLVVVQECLALKEERGLICTFEQLVAHRLDLLEVSVGDGGIRMTINNDGNLANASYEVMVSSIPKVPIAPLTIAGSEWALETIAATSRSFRNCGRSVSRTT